MASPVSKTVAARSAWEKLWAMLRMRCPRCCQARLFSGSFAMNDPCPVCGLIFQREEGYFLGAMYMSYGISSFLLVLQFWLAYLLLPDQHELAVLGLVLLMYLPFMPVVFRYSRTLWIYLERWLCPSDISAGPYEKMRQRELSDWKPAAPD